MARKKKTTDSIAGDETPWASSSRRVGHSARQDVPSTPSTPRVSSKPAPAASKTLCCSSSSRIRRALVAPPLLALVLVPVVLAFVNMRALRRHKAAAAAGMTVASAQGAAASSIASALHINERPWGTNPPRWCKELIANPQERPRTSAIYDCRRGRFGAVCEDGTPRFFSQYNQDIWTWNSVCLACALLLRFGFVLAAY